MPREVGKDKCVERVEAASRKAGLGGKGGSGTAGGKLNPVTFTPGEGTIYNKGKK